MKYVTLATSILAVITILLSCKSGNSVSDDKIVGTYVRQWEGVETHAYTDKVLGKYFVRDTIFIIKKEDGYGIDNRRWRKTDYDTLGWRNAYEGSIKPHTASFDKTDNTLNSPMSMYPPMILDLEKGLLYRSSKRIDPYTKI